MSAVPKRGIKRKRGSDELVNDASKVYKKPSLPPDEKFRRKLHHGVKEVKKAAKTAKTRELQRLVKRLKEHRSKFDQAEAISIIEEQLKVLKTLDHELIATEMLSRRLRKDKHIQANDQVKAVVSEELETRSMPNAEANRAILDILEGRISSSKVLAGPVGDLVAALRALVLPRKMENTEPQLEAADIVTVPEAEGDDGWESGSVLVEDQINGDTDDGRESENRERPPLAPPQVKKRTLIPKTTTSGGNYGPPGGLSSSMHANGTSNETKDTSFDLGTGNSAFIPTLAVGYTRGDSSASDWSGDDGSDDEKIDPKPRKNRRGQRARKAIWEKKYGRNANHIKKEREEEGEARKKRAEKMRHSAGKRSGKAGSRPLPSRMDLENRPKDSGWNNEKEGQPGASGQKEASLHPSWEAAKRKKAAPMIVPSAGKKIVF